MEENLVGYLLNALDPASQDEVEAYFRARPEAMKELETLRRALRPLEADRDTMDPPAGLADRTLARVDVVRRQPIPPAPPIRSSLAPGYSWWRRPDVLVAAGLVLCAIGIGFPGIVRLREYGNRSQCSDNLRELHQSLVSYSDLHDHYFPQVEDRTRRNVAGIYVPILRDSQVLPAGFSPHCPRGETAMPQTVRELEAMTQEDFDRVAPSLSGCYAYTLGYRDADGKLHGLRDDDGNDLPILSDRPLTKADGTECNNLRDSSPNHGGQNVLYVGGHVQFHKLPTVGRGNDHIFLNRNNEVKAGLDRNDTVLGMSADRP